MVHRSTNNAMADTPRTSGTSIRTRATRHRDVAVDLGRVLALGATLAFFGVETACSFPGQTHAASRSPSASVGDFHAAMALWNAGMCAEAETRLQSVDPLLFESPNNRAVVDLGRAFCSFFADGDIARSQALALGVARGSTRNASSGAALASSMFHAVCDFDAALTWAFRAEGARNSWLVSQALASSALIYRHQGRPELAARAATRYLEEFPADWFRSPRSTPPPGSQIDHAAADQIHRENRAILWLLLLDINGDIQVPPQELEALRTIAAPEWGGGIRRREMFLQSEAAAQYHIAELDRLRGILSVAAVLGLDADQVVALKVARDRHTALLVAASGPCAEVANFYRMRGEQEADWVEVPEQSGGTRPTHARQEVDFDVDGLVGDEDLCPHEPERVNGIEDSDGCPDASLAYVHRRQIVITEQVLFATDSADLLTDSLPLLRQVAEILVADHEITLVRVEGHTDHRGTSDHNLSLSSRRAEAVQRFLTSLGVEVGRLEAVGYGSSRPISYGSTEVDMQRNRRVEFLIVERAARPE